MEYSEPGHHSRVQCERIPFEWQDLRNLARIGTARKQKISGFFYIWEIALSNENSGTYFTSPKYLARPFSCKSPRSLTIEPKRGDFGPDQNGTALSN